MTARPILFSAPMVQAILDGRKPMTRRVMKPQPEWKTIGSKSWWHVDKPVHSSWNENSVANDTAHLLNSCPYGVPGDRLWVRETHYRYGHWEPVPGIKTKTGRMKWKFVEDSQEFLYEPPAEYRKGRHHKDPATPAWHKRLARFMPRRVSRLTLEIVDVRVERVQDISDADCEREGVNLANASIAGYVRERFKRLWDSINAKLGFGWDTNPHVWIISFKVVQA